MKFSGFRAFDIAKDLNFERSSGTDGERKAAEYILSKLHDLGYKAVVEEFPVVTCNISECVVEVLEPSSKKITCLGVGLSGTTSKNEVRGRLVYLEDVNEYSAKNCGGSVALVNSWQEFDKVKLLIEQGIGGLILINPFPNRSPPCVYIPYEWNMRIKSIPMVFITYEDAVELLRESSSKVNLRLTQDVIPSKSQNIIAEKVGGKYRKERILVCAHYDTTQMSVGACDNAGGVAILLELARIFSDEKTKRSIDFTFFGSEELWMRGSMDYVKKHQKGLRNIQLLVNIDVQGQLIGRHYAITSGPAKIKDYLRSLTLELGQYLEISDELGVSDCLPFNVKGVPSVWFTRAGGSAYFMHSPEDTIEQIGSGPLEDAGKIIEHTIRVLANAENLPFRNIVPKQKKAEIAKFLNNKTGIQIEFNTWRLV